MHIYWAHVLYNMSCFFPTLGYIHKRTKFKLCLCYVYEYFAFISLCVPPVRLMPKETGRGHQILRCYRRFASPTQGNKTWVYFSRAASAINHWPIISSAPQKIKCLLLWGLPSRRVYACIPIPGCPFGLCAYVPEDTPCPLFSGCHCPVLDWFTNFTQLFLTPAGRTGSESLKEF